MGNTCKSMADSCQCMTKTTSCDIIYMWNLKYDTSELINKPETDP